MNKSKWSNQYRDYMNNEDDLSFNIKKFKGPTHILFFSEIHDNQLLAVVYQNSPKMYKSQAEYGTVDKFLFTIKGKKIIDTLNIKSHYD